VFAVDVLACPDCGGRLKLIAFVADAGVAGRILDHLGLDSRGPPLDTLWLEPREGATAAERGAFQRWCGAAYPA